MKKLILLITVLLVLIYTECSATELGETDKLALKAQVESTIIKTRQAISDGDYDTFMSLLVPADPNHKATEEMFIKHKELLMTANDIINSIVFPN